jgi:hypothetical protein
MAKAEAVSADVAKNVARLPSQWMALASSEVITIIVAIAMVLQG